MGFSLQGSSQSGLAKLVVLLCPHTVSIERCRRVPSGVIADISRVVDTSACPKTVRFSHAQFQGFAPLWSSQPQQLFKLTQGCDGPLGLLPFWGILLLHLATTYAVAPLSSFSTVCSRSSGMCFTGSCGCKKRIELSRGLLPL